MYGQLKGEAMSKKIDCVDDDETEKDAKNEQTEGPLLRLQFDLFNFGRSRAIQSGAQEPVEPDVQSLEEHARAMARENYRESFDPSRYTHDRLRDDEYRKLLKDRDHAESAVKFAAALVRELREALAKQQSGLPQPKVSLFLMFAVAVVIAVTVAPTLHDSIFSTIEDDLGAWFASMLTGGFLGALIAWGILGSFSVTGHRTAVHWVGLAAGLTITLGLGIFRMSAAQGAGEVGLAVALTLVETGVVVLAEWVAAGLRKKHQEYEAKQTTINEASAQLEAAQADHKRCLDNLQEIKDGIAAHISYVEDRELRHLSIQELESVAVKAILDGYNAGIAANRGRIFGVRRV
jgi:hypothetical protein